MMIPAFKTYQALKNEENTAEWSQYWIVWTVFSAAEVVFPLYYELKLGLVLWLSLAKFKGAQIVYDSYISAQEAPKKQDDKVEKHVQTQPSLESNDAERARRRKKQSSSQPALEKSPDKTALPPLKKA
ncbi:hypothetical protein EDD86DRAFT_244451 [Gorgonomyces haynaldii]|nr:hypothetical protein EDD86DRAFT_244451 [Gorgonomyces haynaldii]